MVIANCVQPPPCDARKDDRPDVARFASNVPKSSRFRYRCRVPVLRRFLFTLLVTLPVFRTTATPGKPLPDDLLFHLPAMLRKPAPEMKIAGMTTPAIRPIIFRASLEGQPLPQPPLHSGGFGYRKAPNFARHPARCKCSIIPLGSTTANRVPKRQKQHRTRAANSEC